MKNLTKILTGVGITAATLLGAAIPATAATTPDATGDRLIGQFVMDTIGDGEGKWRWGGRDPGREGSEIYFNDMNVNPQETPTVYSFPGQGTEGPVISEESGLCITKHDKWPEPGAPAQLALTGMTCDGRAEQNFKFVGPLLKYVPDTRYAVSIFEAGSRVNRLTLKTHAALPSNVNLDLLVPQLSEETAPLTASIDSVDHANFSAIASGTGEPGATITITGPTGPLTTLVNENGDWSLEVPGLAAGENVLPVTQTTGTDVSDPIDLTVIIKPLETPIIDPLMAGGAGMLALAIMGGTLLRRKLSIR